MKQCIATILAATAFIAGTQAATVSYNTTTNWSSKTVNDIDTVVINYNAIVNLDQNDTAAILRIANQATGETGTLVINQDYSLTISSFLQLGTQAGAGFVNQSTGSVVAAQVIVNNSGTGDLCRYALSGGTVSATTSATIKNNGELNLSGGQFSAPTLTVDAGGAANLTGGTLNLGGTLTANGTVLVDGGTVAQNIAGTTATIAGTGTVQIASGSMALTGGAATDVVQINVGLFEASGGDVDLTGQVRVGAGAEFRVVGNAAAIDVLRLNNQGTQTGTFRFVFDADGVSTIRSAGYINLSSAMIAVDGSAYAGGAGTFDLFAGTTLTGLAATNNISVTGFDGFDDAYLTQDAGNGTVQLVLRGPAPIQYPPFSWDTVPVYIHFGKTPAALTDDEVALVARLSSFVCLEKGHARIQFGATEPGIANDAARLKAANPGMKILYYWNTFLNYPLYQACATVALHPEWILRDGAGNPVYKDGTLEQYNILNAEFRQWWAAEAGKGVSQYGCDGIFADALQQPLRPIWMPYWAPATAQDLAAASSAQLTLADAAMGSKALLIINGADQSNYLSHADGGMIEHFTAFAATNKESIASDMALIESLGQAGKIAVVKGWPDPDFTWLNTAKMALPYEELVAEARAEITFALACYLAVAQPYSYFCYSWGYRELNGSLVDYLEFHLPLGEPLGPAARNGWVYTRSFEHLEVQVDIENRTATITADVTAAWFNQWLRSQGKEILDGTIADDAEAVQGDLDAYAFGDGLPGLEQGGAGVEYVYHRRRDAAARRLAYTVEMATNLVDAAWSAAGLEETGSGVVDAEFEAVTNRLDVGTTGFVRLTITIGE